MIKAIFLFGLISFQWARADVLPFKLKVSETEFQQNAQWDEIEVKDLATAKKYMKEKNMQIDELLAPALDPYKGTDSTLKMCRQENLPKSEQWKKTNEQGQMRSFYSSLQRVLGLCAAPDEVQKTQYLVLYCKKQKKLFVIRYFYSAQKEWIQRPVVECKGAEN